MEAGRGWRCQPMGQESRPGDKGRVAPLREHWQGAQGQLSWDMQEKRQTHRTNTSWCTAGRTEIHRSFIWDKISTLETRSDAESGSEGKYKNEKRAGEEKSVTSSIELGKPRTPVLLKRVT
eukprot:16449584-Heterocapsa_arctica.AAC.1